MRSIRPNNHLSIYFCARDISTTIERVPFILHRSIPHDIISTWLDHGGDWLNSIAMVTILVTRLTHAIFEKSCKISLSFYTDIFLTPPKRGGMKSSSSFWKFKLFPATPRTVVCTTARLMCGRHFLLVRMLAAIAGVALAFWYTRQKWGLISS